MARRALLILAALGTAACAVGTTDVGVDIWETQLVPESDYPGLTGQAAAVSDGNGTDVGIQLEGAEPGVVHGWRIRLGSCAAPGDGFGPASDYPELAVGGSGSASAETHLGPRLASEGNYHAEVLGAEPDQASRIACGDLVLR